MAPLFEQDVLKALDRIDTGLRRYLWLQDNVQNCVVTTNAEFQKRFTAFYRVRRGEHWRSEFFTLLEQSKRTGINFIEALRAIRTATGRVEASFASKLVATLDPSRPVLDKFVLERFGLRLLRQGTVDRRESRAVEIYGRLCREYSTLLTSTTGVMIRGLFDRKYPDSQLSDIKKIDLVLWQARAD